MTKDQKVFWVCLVIGAFIFGMELGGRVENAKCPENTLTSIHNTNGSVECVVRIDRDPAKVTRRIKA